MQPTFNTPRSMIFCTSASEEPAASDAASEAAAEVSAFVSVGAAVVAGEPDPHAVKEAAITVAIAIDNTLFFIISVLLLSTINYYYI